MSILEKKRFRGAESLFVVIKKKKKKKKKLKNAGVGFRFSLLSLVFRFYF